MENKSGEQIRHSVLRMIPYGLYAVGVREKTDQVNAFMVSWITQCSFDPPLILIAVSRSSTSLKFLKSGRAFSVNLLDRARDDLARLLVKPIHRAGTKLDGVKHHFEGTGAPILDEALAFLECKVESIEEHGDHAIVVGEVVNAGLNRPGEILTCANIGWQYAG